MPGIWTESMWHSNTNVGFTSDFGDVALYFDKLHHQVGLTDVDPGFPLHGMRCERT